MYTEIPDAAGSEDSSRHQELMDEINTLLRMLGRAEQRVEIKQKENHYTQVVVGT